MKRKTQGKLRELVLAEFLEYGTTCTMNLLTSDWYSSGYYGSIMTFTLSWDCNCLDRDGTTQINELRQYCSLFQTFFCWTHLDDFCLFKDLTGFFCAFWGKLDFNKKLLTRFFPLKLNFFPHETRFFGHFAQILHFLMDFREKI